MFALIILAGVLVTGQLDQKPSDARTYNIISLILAITLPALVIPLPFVFEHLKSKENGRWSFQ
jgi:hypothetical protein